MSEQEARKAVDEYFEVFPWDALLSNAEGFDIGCGSGRWARFVAPRVGRLHCIDRSNAIDVAHTKLSAHKNVVFQRASVDSTGLEANTDEYFGFTVQPKGSLISSPRQGTGFAASHRRPEGSALGVRRPVPGSLIFLDSGLRRNDGSGLDQHLLGDSRTQGCCRGSCVVTFCNLPII